MIPLREDPLCKLSAEVFYKALLEYLTKSNKIQHARYYWEKEHPDETFDISKRKQYAKEFPVADIKSDIHKFVVEFARDIRSIERVSSVMPDKSKEFGFSEYIYVTFTPPKDQRLTDFYNSNINDYNAVKMRFSEHKESNKRGHKKSKVKVDYLNKTFLDAAEEMKMKIDNYIKDMERKEDNELKRLIQIEEEEKKKKEKEMQKDSDSDVKNQNESIFRLRVAESVTLDENLEEIASGTYCTDYVGDIVNWLLNKPKPYRILYDKKYDVWCIADAMQNTHKDMSIDLFDSDYLYGVTDDLDGDIQRFREEGNFNDGYTDAEVYSEWLFDNRLMKGCFFIPKNMNYRDYEESGFYSVNIPITTGDIFVTRASELSPSGIFSDLYNKLLIRGAIRKSLKQIWLDLRRKKMDDIDDIVDVFHSEAEKNGYSDEEATEFLNRFGIVNLMTPV